ncbi:hypothetical protein AVEN_229618-1 [Araneus ventricosus]|uniref:Uncharacterized protein n=1 Tax=Araneus ventricosus TaxID=182803 RepID=A0A4Y2UL08_ARAVE|nr:hypothetical protein AVEN_229618-1 [Araneus ventricosus]
MSDLLFTKPAYRVDRKSDWIGPSDSKVETLPPDHSNSSDFSGILSANLSYCPTSSRKTLIKVASRRRVEERKETGIKSIATFGKLSALR